MGLDDLRADLEEARRQKPATFAAWLETADPVTVGLVMEYITDTGVMIDPLVAKLRKNDIPITRETVEKYRDARGSSNDAR